MCSQHHNKVRKPQSLGGKRQDGFYRRLRFASADFASSLICSCRVSAKKNSERNQHQLHTCAQLFPPARCFPELQSCPFFLKFKKLLKKKIIEPCIKVVISPQITREIHSTAKQSTLWTGTYAHIRQEQTPPFLLYVLRLISPFKPLQECD